MVFLKEKLLLLWFIWTVIDSAVLLISYSDRFGNNLRIFFSMNKKWISYTIVLFKYFQWRWLITFKLNKFSFFMRYIFFLNIFHQKFFFSLSKYVRQCYSRIHFLHPRRQNVFFHCFEPYEVLCILVLKKHIFHILLCNSSRKISIHMLFICYFLSSSVLSTTKNQHCT